MDYIKLGHSSRAVSCLGTSHRQRNGSSALLSTARFRMFVHLLEPGTTVRTWLHPSSLNKISARSRFDLTRGFVGRTAPLGVESCFHAHQDIGRFDACTLLVRRSNVLG